MMCDLTGRWQGEAACRQHHHIGTICSCGCGYVCQHCMGCFCPDCLCPGKFLPESGPGACLANVSVIDHDGQRSVPHRWHRRGMWLWVHCGLQHQL